MVVAFCAYVWGERYLADFIDFSVELISSELARMPPGSDISYRFILYTDQSTFGRLSSISHDLLESWEIRQIAERNKAEKYSKLSRIQSSSFIAAVQEGVDVVFPIYSDVVYARGTILKSLAKLIEGRDFVFGIAPQVLITDRDIARRELGPASTLNSFENFVLKNIDPVRGPGVYGEIDVKNSPAVLFFRGEGTLYIRAFHWHPICFRVKNDPAFTVRFYGTLDEHFIPVVLGDLDRAYFFKDTSEYLGCSLEYTSNRTWNGLPSRYTPRSVYIFSESNAFFLHYLMFKNYQFFFRSVCNDNSKCTQTDSKLIQYIERRRARPISDLRFLDPEAYVSRKRKFRTLRRIRSHVHSSLHLSRKLVTFIFTVRSYVAPLLPPRLKLIMSKKILHLLSSGLLSRSVAFALGAGFYVRYSEALRVKDFSKIMSLDLAPSYDFQTDYSNDFERLFEEFHA